MDADLAPRLSFAVNPFVQLLSDFRQAYAEFRSAPFFLGLVTAQEFDAHRSQYRECFLGFIPLGDYVSGCPTPGWYVAGSKWPDWRLEIPWQRYHDLAALAGASLPLAIRRRIPFAPSCPISWWLSFLWHLDPPAEDDLAKPDGINRLNRVPWPQPFLESIDAIEVCKLHSDQPGFPPGEPGVPQAETAAGQTGQPDKKTGQPDSKPDKKVKIPKNPDVCKLINAMRKAPDRDKVEIAREIADGDEKEAESLLRQARRFPDLCR